MNSEEAAICNTLEYKDSIVILELITGRRYIVLWRTDNKIVGDKILSFARTICRIKRGLKVTKTDVSKLMSSLYTLGKDKEIDVILDPVIINIFGMLSRYSYN